MPLRHQFHGLALEAVAQDRMFGRSRLEPKPAQIAIHLVDARPRFEFPKAEVDADAHRDAWPIFHPMGPERGIVDAETGYEPIATGGGLERFAIVSRVHAPGIVSFNLILGQDPAVLRIE